MTFIVASSAVMVIIVAFGLNICEGLGGGNSFLNIYILMIIQNLIVKFT